MKKWLKIILIVIASILALIFTFYAYLLLFTEPQEWMPQEGAWYCEELQMQITFVEGYECYAIVDGTKLPCQACCDKGSMSFYVSVFTLEPDDSIPLGKDVFEGKRIELTETEFTVLDLNTDKEVVFVRVE